MRNHAVAPTASKLDDIDDDDDDDDDDDFFILQTSTVGPSPCHVTSGGSNTRGGNISADYTFLIG